MTDVARALSQPPVAIVEPDWLVHIDAIAGAARQAAADLDAGPLDERRLYAGAGTAATTAAPADSPDAVRDAELPPFFDLLVPMLRVARRAWPPSIRRRFSRRTRWHASSGTCSARWHGRRSWPCSTS